MAKVKQGVTINGVRIPGWLYWHINHWMIDVDIEDPITKYVERKRQKPFFRDNEWLISEHIQRAETDRSGLLILGCRQLGKSEFGASYEGVKVLHLKIVKMLLLDYLIPILNCFCQRSTEVLIICILTSDQ